MQLTQISEPNSGRDEIPRVAVGIDFGTTNSLVAVIKDGKAIVIPDNDGTELAKSIFSYYKGVIKVGTQEDSSHSVSSVKRLLGKNLEEVKHFSQFHFVGSNEINLQIGDKVFSPVEITAHILKYLVSIAEDYLEQKINYAVITVPAYFSEVERHAIKDAAKIIGLNVLRLINEPTAAALAYGLEKKNDEVYLVYDLGGGTFDVSILRKSKGVFQVLASGGDVLLGGDDFDHTLREFIKEKYNLASSDSDLINVARKIKEGLTCNEKVTLPYISDEREFSLEVSREEFASLISQDMQKTVEITKSVISQSNLSISEVHSALLVGGCTRMPLIRNAVEKIFGVERVICDIDADKIVVIGAAIQADALTSSSKNSILIDVSPLSLGLGIMGGLMDVMIERNTPLPTSESRIFTTFCDGQTLMKISVFQGERETVKDNKLLDCFELSGITPLASGKAKINVTFIVDVDGLLTVEAVEEGKKNRKEITVNANYGLSDEEVDKIVANSFEHVSCDLKGRELVETKVEAESITKAVHKAMNECQLTSRQLDELKNLLDDLKNSLQISRSSQHIKAKIELLEKYFHPLIEDTIDQYIKKKIVGTNINEYRCND